MIYKAIAILKGVVCRYCSLIFVYGINSLFGQLIENPENKKTAN